MPVGDFNGRTWDLWCRSLRLSVADGSTALNTAKTTYSRARELVRWLQENGKVKAIPELAKSAEAFLKG